MTAAEHLARVTNKGENIHVEEGFSVFNGHHNIFLGSWLSLVDVLINAGDNEGKVLIEDFAFFGHGVKLLARGHDYNRFDRERQVVITERPIHIKRGTWVGSSAIVLGGVTIGAHSVVGAGNPARVIKRIRRPGSWTNKMRGLLAKIFKTGRGR